MIHCQTCNDTKRHLVYSDTKGRIISEEEYGKFFKKSKSILDSICTNEFGGDFLKFLSSLKLKEGANKYAVYMEEFKKEQTLCTEWVPKMTQCDACVKDEMEAYYQKSRSEAVTGAVFSRLAKEGKIHPDIVEIAKEETMKSFLVIGATGKGKTPLLMLNYNRMVRRQGTTDGLLFTTEGAIRKILENDDNYKEWKKKLSTVHAIFIDEMNREEVWKDLGASTDRDGSNRVAVNMWDFLDYIYQRGENFIAQGAANKSPEETLPGLKNDAAAEYWRRINETFKEIKRVG